MDMDRIKQLMVNLRLANEVETAAEMDVSDFEHKAQFAQRELDAMKLRHEETVQASKEAGNALAEAVTLMVQPPLMLMIAAEEGQCKS